MNNKKFAAKAIPARSSGRSRLITLLRSLFTRNVWLACSMLLISLLITALTALYIRAGVETVARREFDFICNEIRINIANRLAASAQLLRGSAGLFDASDAVTRAEWRAYTKDLEIDKQLPGIQGIGFTQLIQPDQLDQHIQAIRSEGFLSYTVSPAGQRTIYSSIIYLEPFSGRNLRAFGFDMLSEPVRRAAMEQARDENIAVLSGKVTLVQETNQDVQAGTLMYLPVYHHGLPIDTVEQRRAALVGWVYSPYRMTDMMSGTLGGWNVLYANRQISLQVYDGDVVSPETVLYDSQGNTAQASTSPALFTKRAPVDFAGHRWTLRFSWLGGLTSAADYTSVWLALFGGVGVSLLLFGLMISVLRTDINARRMAAQLTTEWRNSEARYRIVVEKSPNAIIIHRNGLIIYANPAAVTLFGAQTAQDLIGSPAMDRVHPDYHQSVLARTKNGVEHGIDAPLVEMKHIRLDGAIIETETQGAVIDYDGAPAIQATLRDISVRKRAEQMLLDINQRMEGFIDEAHVGTWGWNVQTGKTTFNEGWARLVGYTLNELAPTSFKTWESLTHPDDLQKTSALLERHFAGELSYYNCEIRMQHKDGGWVWVHARGRVITHTPDGQPLMMFGTHTDINERKQAEELLRKSERKYHSIIAQSAEGILLVDEDGKIQEWNKALQNLTLLPWEAVANRPVWDVLADLSPSLADSRVSRDDIMHHIKKSVLDSDNALNRTANWELDIQRQDGQHRVVNIIFFNIVAYESRMAAAIYEDVTVSRQQESALTNAYKETLEGWARAIDMRDETTGDHSRRVMEMTALLAATIGIPDEDIVHLRRGALLHDIGKIGVPDRILGKPGPLTDEEWVIMKQHPQYAVDLLQPIEYLHPAMDIPYCHHERWDGSGYPRGLKGEEIPIGARIFAVVDIWDALRYNRPYREAASMTQIRSYLESQAGLLLDPHIVKVFLNLISDKDTDQS